MPPKLKHNWPIRIFISYSTKDEKLKEKLLSHLSPLKRQGAIESWNIQQIRAGDKRDEEILKHLDEANIILCLLSSDFMNSDYCYSVEMKRALEREKLGEAKIIPVLLRAVHLQKTPLCELQAIPRNNKPIADRSNRDKVFLEVAQEIVKVVEAYSI